MEKLKLEKLNHTTLKDSVVATLRKAILYGDLKPGQQLKQDQIAKELNISRMPVREALSNLENEGLIINLPYKGSVVAKFMAEDIREIYQIRKLIEGFAAELATKNMTGDDIEKLEILMKQMKSCLKTKKNDLYASLDKDFHRIIFEKCGNKRLIQLINAIWGSFPMYLAYSIPGRIERSFKEQTDTLEAIRKADPKLAARFTQKQIEIVYEEMVPHFENGQGKKLSL